MWVGREERGVNGAVELLWQWLKRGKGVIGGCSEVTLAVLKREELLKNGGREKIRIYKTGTGTKS